MCIYQIHLTSSGAVQKKPSLLMRDDVHSITSDLIRKARAHWTDRHKRSRLLPSNKKKLVCLKPSFSDAALLLTDCSDTDRVGYKGCTYALWGGTQSAKSWDKQMHYNMTFSEKRYTTNFLACDSNLVAMDYYYYCSASRVDPLLSAALDFVAYLPG